MNDSTKNTPVALVTGAGRRLGRQIAYSLAESGFDLIIHYNTSRKGAQEAVDRIKDLGGRAIAVQADITSRKQVERMIEFAIKKFKHIDLLVNNAGIFLNSPLHKTTESKWDKIIDLNLKGTFLCSQFVSKTMLKNRYGKIINIASLGGLQAWYKHLPYSVSKAGVVMLTRCLAKALAPYIAVNAIAPGTIIIPGEENQKQEYTQTARIPLRKYGKPSDITSLVLYLATTSEYITGQTFVVDGGISI